MKTLVTHITSCLLCAGLLCGCGAASASMMVDRSVSVQYEAMGTAASSVGMAPQTPREAGITYAVETEVLESESFSEDGVKLISSRYELPVLRALRRDGETLETASTPAEEQALLVVNTFNAAFDAWRSEMEDVKDMALADYELRPEMFLEYGMYYQDSLTYTIYTTDHLVSVLASTYSYYGGAHPNTGFCSWNFDLDDGAFLSLPVIAQDEIRFEEAVAADLARQARAAALQAETSMAEFYWEDYEDILANWTTYTVSFDAGGMTVNYAPYELGCYASGPHVFTLSNEFLEPYLSEYGLALLDLERNGTPS